MENLNLNFSGGDNAIGSFCWIMSILSWLLLIASGWGSLYYLDGDNYGIIWTIFNDVPIIDNITYVPFQMQLSLIYIVFILTLTFILIGFCIYMVKSTCKKDDAVYNGMMGKWSKFHFFPLLCVSALFIIGEAYHDHKDSWKAMVISGFVFAAIGLVSLIFIYIMTDLNTDWYVLLTLKKGAYSCLIVLLWYYFCYLIYQLRAIHKDYETYEIYENNLKDFKVKDNWTRGCGIALSIIFGIGSVVFAFIFKDLVVAGMNCLIYVGLTIFYFKLSKEIRNNIYANKNGDGTIDIIMIVLSIVLIAFLILAKREECFKS